MISAPNLASKLSILPPTPEQGGVSERRNLTLLEIARCILKQASLPDCFWAEAVDFADYLVNRLPTKALSKTTPEEVWTGVRPSLANI